MTVGDGCSMTLVYLTADEWRLTMLTNLVRDLDDHDLDDHDLSILHTQNTQNGLVGVACVNPLQKKSRPGAAYFFSTLAPGN